MTCQILIMCLIKKKFFYPFEHLNQHLYKVGHLMNIIIMKMTFFKGKITFFLKNKKYLLLNKKTFYKHKKH